MPLLGSRLFRAAGAFAAAGALALAAPSTSALARGHHHHHHGHYGPQLVNVPMSNAGFTLPRRLHAGIVTFRATSSDTAHMLEGMMLHQGVTVRQIDRELRMAVSRTPAVAAAGVRAVTRDATLVGGPAVEPSTAVSSTMPLTRGTYWFVDFDQYLSPTGRPRFHKVEVCGHFRDGLRWRGPVVAQIETRWGPRFATRPVLDTDDGVLVVNRSEEIHEAVFQRVKYGVTDRTLQLYYWALAHGRQPHFNPFAESLSRGAAAQSPGRWQVVRFQAQRGRYALLCLVTDNRTGLPHAFQGMHKVVWLR